MSSPGLTQQRKAHQGHTLIEILVAATIFLGAMSVAYLGFSTVNRSYHHQSADVDIRQLARTSIDSVSQYLRMGCYIFDNRTVTMDGVTYTVPAAGSTGNYLIFAYPESGLAGSIKYTVVGYYLQNITPPDIANPTAMRLIMWQKNTITPPIADQPSSINLSSLTGGARRMLGAYYVRPSGLEFTLSNPAKTVRIHLEVEKRDLTNMPLLEEDLYTQVTLRNL
jgi:hypothetical protein